MKTSAPDRHADKSSNDENLTRKGKEEDPCKPRQSGLFHVEYKDLNNLIIPKGVLPYL